MFVLLTSCIYGWARMAEFESRELKDAPLIGCVREISSRKSKSQTISI